MLSVRSKPSQAIAQSHSDRMCPLMPRSEWARADQVFVMKHFSLLSLAACALALASCGKPEAQWNQETLPPGDSDKLPPSQTVPGQSSPPGDAPVSNRPQGS